MFIHAASLLPLLDSGLIAAWVQGVFDNIDTEREFKAENFHLEEIEQIHPCLSPCPLPIFTQDAPQLMPQPSTPVCRAHIPTATYLNHTGGLPQGRNADTNIAVLK